MGALIFLLLVTTRRIQKQALQATLAIEASGEQTSSPDDPPNIATGLAAPSELAVELLPLQAPLTTTQSAEAESSRANREAQLRWEREQADRRAFHEAERIARELEAEALRSEWKEAVEELQSDLQHKQSRLAKLFDLKNQLHHDIESLEQQERERRQALSQEQAKTAELNTDIDKWTAAYRQLLARADQLDQQLERFKAERSSQVPETEIVAYDALTGTSRRPILIECREKEIVFAAEGVVLTAKDLSGFPPEYNPLKAGAEALVQHWSNESGTDGLPYVLLVVRPSGTTAFYVARGLLSKMEHHFGYELLEQDTPLHWPHTDPAAIEACQAAVMRVLRERERVELKLGRRAVITGPLNYADSAGRFHLPEVESLENADPNRFLGSERWSSPLKRHTFNDSEQPESRPPGNFQNASNSPHSTVPNSDTTDRRDNTSQPQDESSQSSDRPLPLFAESTTVPQNAAPQNAAPQNAAPQSTQRVFEISPRGTRSSAPAVLDTAKSLTPLHPGRSIEALSANPFEQFLQTEASGPGGPDGMPRIQSRGTIGIEREVEVHLWADRLRVDEGQELPVAQHSSPTAVQQQLRARIAEATSTWDAPPKSFFWKPILKVVIHPGGIAHYAQAKELADRWNVPSRIEYEIQ